MKRAAVVMCAGVLSLVAVDANAQMLQWQDRGFLNVSGGVQTGTTDASSTVTFPLYDETATVSTSRELKGSPIWDVTGGVRVWSNMAVGVSVAGRSKKSDGAVSASLPDPVFYDQNRTVTSSLTGMKHSEVWVTPMATWMFPVTEKFEVMAMVGPTVAMVKHDSVSGATVTEGSSPTVTVSITSVSKSVWGVMGGLDGRYLVSKNIGVGAFARYAKASVNLGGDAKLDVGGFQVGGGIRVRF